MSGENKKCMGNCKAYLPKTDDMAKCRVAFERMNK